MTVSASRYVPLFSSERTVPKPWIGCGVVSYEHLVALATLGESQTKPNGRPYTQADLTDRLRVGLRAFHSKPDSNGIPDRDDAGRIMDAMFPWLTRDLIPLVSRDFDEVVEWLKADNVISIALFLAALPAGAAAAKFTRAPHQVTIHGLRNGKTTDIDGMHPPAIRWGGFQVPLGQIEKAAKSFPESRGLVLAWRAPIGGWTQAALQTEALRKTLRDERDKVAVLTTQRDNKERKVVELRKEIVRLTAAGSDCAPLVDNARHAGWTGALENIRREADRLIVQGPPG